MTGQYVRIPLKRFGRVVGGSTPQDDERFWGGDIPWYTPTDVSAVHGRVLGDSARTLTKAGLRSCSAALLPAGSVVMTSRAPVGNVAITDRIAATNQGCKSLIPGPATNARFVAYAARAFLADILVAATGTTFQEINGERLGTVSFPKPDPQTQSAIASFLDDELERIDAALGRASPAKVALSTRAQTAFSAIPAIGSAQRVRLRFLLLAIEQGWSPECDQRLAEPGEWGVTKAGSANYGRFSPEEHKALPAGTEPVERYELAVGDVVMSRANTRELAGSVARVRGVGGWRLLMCDKLYRLIPNEAEIDPDFLVFALNSRETRNQIEAATSGASSSMQNISQDVVSNLRLPLPSLEEQHAAVATCNRVQDEVASASRPLAAVERALVEYRASLIYEAVTGRLDVTRASEPQMEERLHAVADRRLDEVAV